MIALNIALTQLHLNSWAFVKAFEVLCKGLEVVSTTIVFFYFVECRLSKRSSWFSLNSVRGRNLLSLMQLGMMTELMV